MTDRTGIVIRRDIHQKTSEWIEARRGLITASTMNLLMTPTGKAANNEKTRQHLYELAAQRVTGYVEPSFISDHMLRGELDEETAVKLYRENVAPVEQVALITNDCHGFTLAYSPDGLVGDDGLIECKSRMQKYHMQTIIEHIFTGSGTVPQEYVLQIQAALLISERKWCDFISYCGGMPMIPIRVFPDPEMQEAIIEAVTAAEEKIADMIRRYYKAIGDSGWVIATERRNEDMLI